MYGLGKHDALIEPVTSVQQVGLALGVPVGTDVGMHVGVLVTGVTVPTVQAGCALLVRVRYHKQS